MKKKWGGGIQKNHLVYEDGGLTIIVHIESGAVSREQWIKGQEALDIIAAHEKEDFHRFLDSIDEKKLYDQFEGDDFDDDDDFFDVTGLFN